MNSTPDTDSTESEAQPHARLTFGTCHCGETERVMIEDHCAPCIENCRPDLLSPPTQEPRAGV